MTHPLTPREKVAAVVLDAAAAYLIQQYGASHGLDHEVDRARIMSAIPNDAILAALASGSGDHAELARLAEAVGLLSEVADEFGCTIEQYHKNGPHWTSADGEMFDVGVILDREPIIERIRTFLSKEAERG